MKARIALPGEGSFSGHRMAGGRSQLDCSLNGRSKDGPFYLRPPVAVGRPFGLASRSCPAAAF